MATLYITEYVDEGNSGYGKPIPVAIEPGLDQTPVVFSTSTQSAAFANNTRFVRLCTDATCSVNFGANPTATTNNKRLPADTIEYFAVTPGHKVAVIANT